MKKYHIDKNTIQETLIIPLFGRKVCSKYYPDLLKDEEAERLCEQLDYDFSEKEKLMTSPAGLFGAMEVAQRHYDLICEIRDYLKDHPEAAVVNMGCGLDDTFQKINNGLCKGYNIDMPDVITIREEILLKNDREVNIGCDLNDYSWMDKIDGTKGAIFFAAGVFYYFKKDEVKKLFKQMAQRFPNGVLVFDSCNKIGADMMRKTWLKQAGISDVKAYFSLQNKEELEEWSDRFVVSEKSYMRGYRDIYYDSSLFYKIMIRFCDTIVRMKIVKIKFKEV